MAQIQNPIIGRAKGQTGGQVFYTWFGKNVMRSKPFSYRTPTGTEHDQKVNRFKAGNELAAKVKGICKDWFKPLPTTMPVYSIISGLFIKMFSFVGEVLTFTPSSENIGAGNLSGGLTTGTTFDGVDTLTVPFIESGQSEYDKDSDLAVIILTKADGTGLAELPTEITRAAAVLAGEVEVEVPEILFNAQVYVSSIRFVSADGLSCSPFIIDGGSEKVTLTIT